MTLDKEIIFISHQRYKGGNRDYYSHFSVTLEVTSKLLVFFVKLIWEKLGQVDGLTGSRQEIEIKHEFDFKLILKDLLTFISRQRHKGGNRDYRSYFSVIFERTSEFLIVFVRLILAKIGVDQLTGPRREIDIKYKFDLKISLKRFLQPFLIELPSSN